MKITISVPRFNSSLESEQLVRFVMRQISETNEPDSTEPSPVLLALTLAAVSHDKKFHDRLTDLISSSSDKAEEILKMCKDVFMPALGWLQNGQSSNDPDEETEYSFPEERTCRRVLFYALREGKKMLASGSYEFVRVFESLCLIGLQCYSFRLYQFEAVRESFQNDPENLVRRGVEIIKAAYSTRNEN